VADFLDIEPLREAAAAAFMSLSERPECKDRASALLLQAGESVLRGLMEATRSTVSLKRHLELVPLEDGLDSREHDARTSSRRLGVVTHYPVLSPRATTGSVSLDCRTVTEAFAGELLQKFAALDDPEHLALSHFDTGHLFTTGVWIPFVAALCKCRSLALTDCVLAANEDMRGQMRPFSAQFTSLVLHNVVGTSGSRWLVPLLLGHAGLVSIKCSGEATTCGGLGSSVWRAACRPVLHGNGEEQERRVRQMQAINIQWGLESPVATQAGETHTPAVAEMLTLWPTLRSLCICRERHRWADLAAVLASGNAATALSELRLLPRTPLEHDRVNADEISPQESGALFKAIADGFLARSRLHKLDMRAAPMRGPQARAALSHGLLLCATPDPQCPAPTQLVHLALHMGVDDLGVLGEAGAPLIEALQSLLHLTHLHLRLGGPDYAIGGSRLAEPERHPQRQKAPSLGTWQALQCAIGCLTELKVLVLQIAVAEADYGFRGWRSLPTSCGDLYGSGRQPQQGEGAGGVCVLAGEADYFSEWMRAALPMGGRVRELQVWDCWDSLSGDTTIADRFQNLHSLVVGHSDGVRMGSTHPPAPQDLAYRLAPCSFASLQGLLHLRNLSVVSSKCRHGTLQSVSTLTGLQVLVLSALELPAAPAGPQELQTALAPLLSLTRLVIRNCTLENTRPDGKAHARDVERRGVPIRAISCFPEDLRQSPASVPRDPAVANPLRPLQQLRVVDLMVRAPHTTSNGSSCVTG
jgi:hypothetical protein